MEPRDTDSSTTFGMSSMKWFVAAVRALTHSALPIGTAFILLTWASKSALQYPDRLLADAHMYTVKSYVRGWKLLVAIAMSKLWFTLVRVLTWSVSVTVTSKPMAFSWAWIAWAFAGSGAVGADSSSNLPLNL